MDIDESSILSENYELDLSYVSRPEVSFHTHCCYHELRGSKVPVSIPMQSFLVGACAVKTDYSRPILNRRNVSSTPTVVHSPIAAQKNALLPFQFRSPDSD